VKVRADHDGARVRSGDLARLRESLLTPRIVLDLDRRADLSRCEREGRATEALVDGYEDPFGST